MRNSHTHFVNNLNRMHDAFKNAMNNVALASLNDDKARKEKALEELLKAVEKIREFIHESELPKWVLVIEGALKAAINDPSPSNLQNLGLIVAQNFDAAIKHVWVYVDDSDTIDIQEELRSVYDHSNLQALFEDLVEKIKILLETGEVEHVSAEKSLKALIDIIRKNSKKPANWPWLKAVCRGAFYNFGKIYPTKENANPEFAAAIQAVWQAYDEVEAASETTNKSAHAKLEAVFQKQVPLFKPSDSLQKKIGYVDVPKLESNQDDDQSDEVVVEE